MENKKPKDEILDSLRGIRRAEPNPFLFTRIEAKISTATSASIASPSTIRLAFALSITLVLLNVGLIINHSRRLPMPMQESSYALDNDRYNLYQ